MLTESLLSTIVQVSVTGAGLVLAVYALIIPISRKMFTYRASLLHKQIQEFEKQRQKLTAEDSNKELKRLQQLSVSINQTKRLPRYLTYGVFLTFVLYMLSAIFGFGYLYNPSGRTIVDDWTIIGIFFGANMGFLFVGIYTIVDIALTMKKDYDRIKRSVEENEEFQGLFVK